MALLMNAMMLLTAKCHKLANEFANNAPDSKVTLLMLPEKYVHTDCRSFHSRVAFLPTKIHLGTQLAPQLMPACARRVHYMSDPNGRAGSTHANNHCYIHSPATDGEIFTVNLMVYMDGCCLYYGVRQVRQ